MNRTMDETTIKAFAAHLWASSTTEQILDSTDDDNDSKSDEISHFPRPLLTFAAVMTITIMIVGICGNLLTIIALIKCPKVRNVAAAFIISLCIADCIFCAIVLPFSAFRFIQGTWTHGELLCRLIPFIQYGNIGVSLLCIAMITINRYIMITHHSSYARIYKRHWIAIMIAFCWLFSYGMQLPTFFGIWGSFGYDPKLGTCSILKDEYGRSSKTPLFIIAFVIPCIIIVGCYARIFWVVHESEVRLRKHASKQNSIPNNLRPIPPTGGTGSVNGGGGANNHNRVSSPLPSSSFSSGGGGGASIGGTTTDNPHGGVNTSSQQKSMRVKDQRDVKAKRNEWRITKMVLAIFLSFIMCYLPITVIKVTDKDVKMPGFHVFGYIMLYLSSCINPIIYVIMNKQYRQAYKTVLMCKPSRLLPFTNAGSSVGEKWKDIGYSYNHSRTMVSQISIADQNNSTTTTINQPQQSVIMELTNNNNINSNTSNNNNNNRHSYLEWASGYQRNSHNTSNTNNNRKSLKMIPPIPSTTNNNITQQNSNSDIITRNISNTNTNITASTMVNNNQHPLHPQYSNNNNTISISNYQQPSVRSGSQQQSIQMLDSQRRGTRINLEGDDIIAEEMEPDEMIENHLQQQQVKGIPDNISKNFDSIKNVSSNKSYI